MSGAKKAHIKWWMDIVSKAAVSAASLLFLSMMYSGYARATEILDLPKKHEELKKTMKVVNNRIDKHDTMFVKVIAKLDTLIERDKRELTEREIRRRVDSLIKAEKYNK